MKNIKLITKVLSCILIFSNVASAQTTLNREMYSIAKASSKPGWINLDENANLNIATLFTENKIAFGLSNEDEMRLRKTETDHLGYKHYRFEQYYKGIRVDGGQYIVHQNNDGLLYSANGKIISGLNKNVSITLNENAALEKGKAATGAKSFAWEDANLIEKDDEKKKKKFASLFPKGELLWVTSPLNKADDAFTYNLCYKFAIAADTTGESKIVFVNANDGTIVKELPLEINCNTVYNPTVFNGPQLILTAINSNNNYYLENDCSYNPTIHVMDANISQTQNYLTEIESSNGTILFDGQDKIAGVQVFWALRQAQRYYSLEHSRDSYDDAGATIEGQIKALYNTNGVLNGGNANWSPSLEVFRFGYGNSSATNLDDYISLDIVSHEFTHAVTQYTAGLVYAGEPGALNESFSDIFGEVIENYSTGTNDWLIGAEIGALRSFANPDSFFQPRTYYGTNWATTNCGTPGPTNDNCGVHTNSGVQNRMFYLLCVGGTVTVGGTVCNISGIGIQDAAAIAYRALSVYLTSNSNYYDSREAWIRAANDIFGHCSNQSVQTGNAWYAVQVGQSLNDYNINKCGFEPQFGAMWDVEYNAINTLVASPSNCGNIIMQSNVAVNYDAAQSVRLLPGFHAQSGCHFNARIDVCAVTNYKSASSHEIDEMSHQLSENKIAGKFISAVKAKPNPFSNELNIQFELEQGNEVTVMLFDLLGKQTSIPTYKDSFGDGSSSIQLNTSDLPSGMYILRVICGNESHSIKVVK